jgi:hypothetical protein
LRTAMRLHDITILAAEHKGTFSVAGV